MQPVLLNGQWQASQASGSFQAENPATMTALPEQYPISTWADIDAALDAATKAAVALKQIAPEKIAAFLDDYAARIEARADEVAALANAESGLPVKPRLRDVELPRTVNQLRLAAKAARERSWAAATIDTAANIRSCLEPIGPVWVFGPNNFPLAFNSIAGGDFVAAIAAGNPVIAKANTSHPGTSRLLAELAFAALQASELPAATIQMIYRTSHSDGERLIRDPRTASLGYTGSRSAGLVLKRAADELGKPVYLELSSVNPVVFLPGALAERGAALVDEYAGSCTMGAGQFCTNPGLFIVMKNAACEEFIAGIVKKFTAGTPGTLLTKRVQQSLVESVDILQKAGAKLLCGGTPGGGAGYSFANTLLQVSAKDFVSKPEALQTEAFGNVALCVVADDVAQIAAVLTHLEGNLTGTIYSSTTGADEELYQQLEPLLRAKVGRLLNDKMPTGVAVSPAMNHGGPFPATGHPGFTAVGIPASLRRFAALLCYDNVRAERLPSLLQNKNPTGQTWRLIDGAWSTADVA